MSITKDQVLHVATLARLELGEAELTQLGAQLGAILDHVDQLGQVDTSGVAVTEHLAVTQLPVRADEVRKGLSPEVALAAAPRVLNGGFGVPEFVED